MDQDALRRDAARAGAACASGLIGTRPECRRRPGRATLHPQCRPGRIAHSRCNPAASWNSGYPLAEGAGAALHTAREMSSSSAWDRHIATRPSYEGLIISPHQAPDKRLLGLLHRRTRDAQENIPEIEAVRRDFLALISVALMPAYVGWAKEDERRKCEKSNFGGIR